MPDAGAVRFALVPSGKVHYRKALLVKGLHEPRATLVEQHGAERRNVDPQHRDRRGPRSQDHIDPPDQSHRIERDETDRST